MNWGIAGALGELIGGIAVIFTLGYLAIQMKQNAIGMKVAAKQEMTRQFGDFADLLLKNPELRSVWSKGLAATKPDELTEEEILLFSTLAGKALWYFSSMHYQRQLHDIADDDWRQSDRLIAQHMAMPGFQGHWAYVKDRYSSEFCSYMESHIEEADT